MSILRKIISKSYDFRMKFSKITGMGMDIKNNDKNSKPFDSFYKLHAKTNNGEVISFEKFKGKKVLLVNLASQCGYTPQYSELEKLNQLHKEKITIPGFPSNDFGGQEPGTDKEIADFCKVNFGVTFPLFQKDHVAGKDRQPVYEWLSNANKNGWNNQEPSWNFYKYLVDEEGNLNKLYSSSVSPLSIAF